MSEYQILIEKIFQSPSKTSIHLGLERIFKLHNMVGNPAENFDSIHVAGTNGKGSVCWKIACGLQAAGYRVGLFTSPHISTFRERIRINGAMISEESVVRILKNLMNLKEIATFFELTTLLAFIYFAEEKVDVAVIETGLGGRLDATNIVEPKLSIVTSIGMDHEQFLGDSIEKIAVEKLGIVKKNIPLIIGPSVPLKTACETVEKMSSTLFQIAKNYPTAEEENQAIAAKALEFLKVPLLDIQQAISKCPPCRFEVVNTHQGVIYILDVAHNPAGIKQLFRRVKLEYPNKKIRAVVGFSKDKNIKGCLDILRKECLQVGFITSGFNRLISFEEVLKIDNKLHYFPHIQQALEIQESDEVIVVCGSFFIMSEVRKNLGIDEICDSLQFQ